MNEFLRPLTKKQLAELRAYVAPSTAVFRVVLFALLAGIVGILFRVAQKILFGELEVPWWLLPAAAVMLWLYLRLSRWTGGSSLRRRIKSDIAGGNAAVQRIEAMSAIEFEEQEDEGPAFLVSTRDGQAILFAGQYLVGPKSWGFPWLSFEIIEAPASCLFLGIEKLGDPLSKLGKRAPLSYDQLSAVGSFDKEYVFLDEEARIMLAET
jgi:hypothetical protein